MYPSEELLGLAIIAGIISVVAVGYLLAWRSNRAASRRAGSLVVAAIAGLVGLFGGLVADRRRQPYPASRTGASSRNCDCSSSLASSVLPRVPLGALYVSGRFFRRALRDERGKDWLAINRARNGVLTAFRCALVLRIRGGSGFPGRRRGGRKLWDRLHLDFRQERGLPAYGPLAP
jgi:hypothetical protein